MDLTAARTSSAHAVTAFLKASREGSFGDLLQLLDPDVELRADSAVVAAASAYADAGAPLLEPVVHGADAVARVFAGRAEQATLALIDGWPGAVYASEGVIRAAYILRLSGHRIVEVEVVGDAAELAHLEVSAAPVGR